MANEAKNARFEADNAKLCLGKNERALAGERKAFELGLRGKMANFRVNCFWPYERDIEVLRRERLLESFHYSIALFEDSDSGYKDG